MGKNLAGFVTAALLTTGAAAETLPSVTFENKASDIGKVLKNEPLKFETSYKCWNVNLIVVWWSLFVCALVWVIARLWAKCIAKNKEERIKNMDEYRKFLEESGVDLNDPNNPLLSEDFVRDMLVQISKLKKEIRNTLWKEADLKWLLEDFETVFKELKEKYMYDHDKLVEIDNMRTKFNEFYEILRKYGIQVVPQEDWKN